MRLEPSRPAGLGIEPLPAPAARPWITRDPRALRRASSRCGTAVYPRAVWFKQRAAGKVIRRGASFDRGLDRGHPICPTWDKESMEIRRSDANPMTALTATVAAGHLPDRRPVLLSTDCGCEMDDQWALALLARAPTLDLRGVVTPQVAGSPCW